jgi:hypothetical protein
MTTLPRIIFILCTTIIYSCSQKDDYSFNDWIELNLKNNPKYIIETSSFTPNELLNSSDSILEWWLERPLKEWFHYKIYSFDADGFITQEELYDPDMDFPNDDYLGDKIRSRITRNDSVIISICYELLPEDCIKKTYVLDEIGLPIKKIVSLGNSYPIVDSYVRDKHNKVVRIYSKGSGIDSSGESVIDLTLNKFGDPIEIIDSGKTFSSNYNETQFYVDTIKYKYIYDKYDNWIIKAEISNGVITQIIQRTIKY